MKPPSGWSDRSATTTPDKRQSWHVSPAAGSHVTNGAQCAPSPSFKRMKKTEDKNLYSMITLMIDRYLQPDATINDLDDAESLSGASTAAATDDSAADKYGFTLWFQNEDVADMKKRWTITCDLIEAMLV